MRSKLYYELKKCPFCGGTAHLKHFKAGYEKYTRYQVKCSECWCGTLWEFYEPEKAVEAWNRRSTNE